jgi:hypothetical protein
MLKNILLLRSAGNFRQMDLHRHATFSCQSHNIIKRFFQFFQRRKMK